MLGKCTGAGSSPRLNFTTMTYEGDLIRSVLLFAQHPLLPGPLPTHVDQVREFTRVIGVTCGQRPEGPESS